MSFLLWVDDDLNEYPAIKRIARKHGLDVETRYSLADAIDWINEVGHPRLVLLDAIVPIGHTLNGKLGALVNKRKGGDDFRYTGLMLLDIFPEMAKKTLIFSIVPEERLLNSGLAAGIKIFPKADLGRRLDDFRREVARIVDGATEEEGDKPAKTYEGKNE